MMMKYARAGALALALALPIALSNGAANAADLGPYSPPPMAAPQPIYNAQPFTWSGFYLGIQGGYGWGQTDAQSGAFGGALNEIYSYESNGFLGGVHAGFNLQARNLVFGIETDLEGTNISGTGYGTFASGHRTNLDWLGSLRGRLGFAAGNTLFYGTAGLAYGGVTIDKSAGQGLLPYATYSDMRTGWTAGAGIEHAFTPNLTARLEYRYTDLGGADYTSATTGAADHGNVTSNAVRAGLSYKF